MNKVLLDFHTSLAVDVLTRNRSSATRQVDYEIYFDVVGN